MADPLIQFIEKLIIVDEALIDVDTGTFVESLLCVYRELIGTSEEGNPKGENAPRTNPDEPILLQRCESDDDVPEVGQYQPKKKHKPTDQEIGWSDD